MAGDQTWMGAEGCDVDLMWPLGYWQASRPLGTPHHTHTALASIFLGAITSRFQH